MIWFVVDAEKAKQVDEKSDDVSMECVEYVDGMSDLLLC